MKVRLWKNGKPKDLSGGLAVAAVALLIISEGVKIGLIRGSEEGYFAPLVKAGKIYGNVAFSKEEMELLSALEVAGELKRKAERSVRLKVAGRLN